ncbi:YsnF/AvaK domain-containing protein, partial [Singulisphaera rosea]
HRAYDMNTHGNVATAMETTTPVTKSASTRTKAKAAKVSEGDTIQVKEERLHADKRPVEAGEVRVRKEVHTETKTLEIPVEREEVIIERTPVHGRTSVESIREGEEIRIPVREEQVTVSKDAVVIEEVKVGKRVVKDTKRVSGQVRKEEVKVEQQGNVEVHSRGSRSKNGLPS